MPEYNRASTLSFYANSILCMIEPWHHRSSEVRGDHRVFRVREDVNISPETGQPHTFSVIEASSWVNIIPITPAGNVVMIRQYRHGVRRTTLEVPGGIVDDGESPREAAIREMLEETGYVVDDADVSELGSVAPNPAILNNTCYSFIARGVRLEAPQRLDGTEIIEVVEVPLEDIPHKILSGEITHSLVICAFHLMTIQRD